MVGRASETERRGVNSWEAPQPLRRRASKFLGIRERDESKRHGDESQRIVAARPLCRLQYPVAYLSRLQRILPAVRKELYFKAADAARPLRRLRLRHVPLGALRAPTEGRQTDGGRMHRF